MKQKCQICNGRIQNERCAYCGAVVQTLDAVSNVDQSVEMDPARTSEASTEQLARMDHLQQDDVPAKRKWKMSSFIGSSMALLVFMGVFVLAQLNQAAPEELRYLCTHEPTSSGIEQVTIIESYGLAITRWVEQYIFPRQVYIDYNWGVGWDLTDADIKDWYEGPENITEMEGTYWELIAINDEFVTIQFVYHYEIMSRADLDLLWDPNFSGVNHHTAIRTLTEDEGAICSPV
ncbi:MAG: hypothetical protein FWG67_05275 [Defluviitaleaceae bacterium]|nr:hypothetical protein [Defluviitaleaceae bacterium]